MRLALILPLLGLAAAASAAGSVEGEVSLLGRRGPESDLSEVVVYLEGGPGAAAQPGTAEIRMKRKSFEPGIAVVAVGGAVEFPNDDPILHNVFSVSGENRFDLELYKRPERRRQTFKSPGVVRVYCNIHPQMAAFVLVTDSQHHALAQKSGRFRIDGVPPGRYRVKAWHARAREDAVAEIVVPAQGGVGGIRLELDATRYRPGRHKNKYGKEYEKDKY